jgi:hypothetical protein
MSIEESIFSILSIEMSKVSIFQEYKTFGMRCQYALVLGLTEPLHITVIKHKWYMQAVLSSQPLLSRIGVCSVKDHIHSDYFYGGEVRLLTFEGRT